MKTQIFTFWEGTMPEYIKLCMNTWKFDYTVLDYSNLSLYTDLLADDKLKRFSLPKIADCVRVHVLRDNGGYWLDADTIMLSCKLPMENMVGYPTLRTNTIGYLHTDPHTEMYERWAKYQDYIISSPIQNSDTSWDVMGNHFTDDFVKAHKEITIKDVTYCWPETYMVNGANTRKQKYKKFYFDDSYHLSDLTYSDMIMLHNSWTPKWYKDLSRDEVLNQKCTLSNILREVLN